MNQMFSQLFTLHNWLPACLCWKWIPFSVSFGKTENNDTFLWHIFFQFSWDSGKLVSHNWKRSEDRRKLQMTCWKFVSDYFQKRVCRVCLRPERPLVPERKSRSCQRSFARIPLATVVSKIGLLRHRDSLALQILTWLFGQILVCFFLSESGRPVVHPGKQGIRMHSEFWHENYKFWPVLEVT